MRPEVYSELGKACLNIAVGLVIVGILQPYLSRKATLEVSLVILAGILIALVTGVILLNKGGAKDDNHPN